MENKNQAFAYCSSTNSIRLLPASLQVAIKSPVSGKWIIEADAKVPVELVTKAATVMHSSHAAAWGTGEDVIEALTPTWELYSLEQILVKNCTRKNKTKFDAKFLRAMRNEAGLTQDKIAKAIGISRETVVAIENEHPKTIKSLGFEVVNDWWRECSPTLAESTRLLFKATILRYFGM